MAEPSVSAGERDAELVTELRAVIAAQATQIEALTGQVAEQRARIAELERRLGADSSNSSRPPSSDSPYRKPAKRSSRRASGGKPGKKTGEPGATMPLVDDPDKIIIRDQTRCEQCGADLADAPISRVERRQITDVRPPPPPRVTEYQILTRTCPCCAATAAGSAPAGVPARAQYGPGVLARAAELLCAHYLPVGRATALMTSLLGISVSVGFMGGVRARAARLLEQTFMPRVRELLRSAGVLHVDECPATRRAAR